MLAYDQTDINDDDMLDSEQAAEFLKIHVITLTRKAATGEIPGAKIGRRWVFCRPDLVVYYRSLYKGHGQAVATDNHIAQGGNRKCQLSREKIRRSTGSDSRSAVDELMKLLNT